MPPDLLVWLVNEWGDAPRAAAGEEDAPYPDPAPLGTAAGNPAEAADRLHLIFSTTDMNERIRLLALVLAQTGVRPGFALVSGVPSETWHVDDPGQALLASAALTLRHQLAAHDPARAGICTGRASSGQHCADAYIDASPGGQRRFCSVTCQNRARVAAWRQRRNG